MSVPGILTSKEATTENSCRQQNAMIRRGQLQARGSYGELLGMGRRKTLPAEEMRKTLPAMSMDWCFEALVVAVVDDSMLAGDGQSKYEAGSR
jgi:hypothetical protein